MMRQEFRAARRRSPSALFVTAKRLAVGCLAVLHVLLLLLPLGRAVSSPVPAKPIAPPRRTHGAWSLSSFRDFVDARLGPPSCPVVWWALEGQLTSPTTGDVIAEVRGLEVVRCVGRGGLGGEKKKKGDGSAVAYAGLSTEGCLSSSPAGREVEAYATAVSRRAFLYLDPVTKQPMTSFRMSRRSKARDVPLPAPLVRVLTFALVVVKRRSSSTSQGEEQGQQQQSQQQDVTSSRVMTLVSERLAGGETVAVDSEGGPFLPPKRHQRWPVGGGKRLDLSLLTWPGSTRKKRRRHGEDEEEQGGPRAWLRGLVHLGPMRAAPAVREVYSLSLPPRWPWAGSNGGPVVMQYVRYGEGPWWFGGGRPATLALRSTRYLRYKDVPAETRSLVLQHHQDDDERGWREGLGLEGAREAGEAERTAEGKKRFWLF